MNRNVIIPILISIGMIVGFTYFSSGVSLLVTFVPGVILALLFYFLTVYRKQPEPQRILPLYLLALGFQFIHFTEEYWTGFNTQFPALFDSPEYTLNLFVGFNMSAYFMFILGAIMIYKKIKTPMIIPLFFVVYGTLGNAIAHVIFCIAAGGYFPGIYTALIYWVIGPMLIIRIWKETRVEKGWPKDILDQIELDFKDHKDEVISILGKAWLGTDYLTDCRIIRCILFLANKSLEKLDQSVQDAQFEPRDVMLWAEYEHQGRGPNPKRLRDFNKTFGENEVNNPWIH